MQCAGCVHLQCTPYLTGICSPVQSAIAIVLWGGPAGSIFSAVISPQETAARAEQAAGSPSKVATESAAAGAHEALLAQAGVGELYVRLLCQCEPGAVLPFLQAHDAYRVEEVLLYTERFGVADAQVRPSLRCPARHHGVVLETEHLM